MALVNMGLLAHKNMKNSSKFFSSETKTNKKKKKKNIADGPLKNSGDRSRAIMALLFSISPTLKTDLL